MDASNPLMSKENIEHAGSYGVALESPLGPESPARNARARPEHPVQNWVLDPVQDLLFIIAAPLLCLGAYRIDRGTPYAHLHSHLRRPRFISAF